MAQSLNMSGACVALFVLWLAWNAWSKQSRYLRAAKTHSCEPAPSYPNWDFFLGMDAFIKIHRYDRQGRRSRAYQDLHHSLGLTFQMKACSLHSQIQTANPKNVQAISSTQFNDFGVGPMRGNIGAPFLDRGVFTEDGEFWKHSRALIRPTFSRAEIADLNNFELHVARFLALIPRDGQAFDIQPLAKRLLLDTSTEFIFGQSIESLLPETPFETDEFMQAFDYSLLGLALRLLVGPLKFLFVLDPTWKRAYTKVHKFVDKLVAAAIDNQNRKEASKKKNLGAGSDEPRKYVLLEEMAKETKDPYKLRNEGLNIFFPARDTAAIAFGDSMFELARHPEWWMRLREEILALGPEPSLSFELLKSLKVTKAIISETLRLHPAASHIGRAALKDTVLPVGGGADCQSPLFIPKGQTLEMDLYVLHRDPDSWGADAEQFNPGRWLNEDRPLWEAKWQYAPFLGGTRMCPARQQVLTQLSYLLVRMAQNFKAVKNEDGVFEYLEEVRMTVASRNSVQISLDPA